LNYICFSLVYFGVIQSFYVSVGEEA